MLTKEINFDRFVRGALYVALAVVAIYIIRYLSSVLIPFFIAWILAYLLFPIVSFLQYKCHLRIRLLCIFLTIALVGGIIGGLAWLCIPTIIEEGNHLKDIAISYIEGSRQTTGIIAKIQQFYYEHASQIQLGKILRQDNVIETIKEYVPRLWEMLWSTTAVIGYLVGLFFGTLYLFFILSDYEKYSEGWIKFVPHSKREFFSTLVQDIERGMSGYFRGQALVALSNCVMFTIGFFIIGFPMPVFLGVLIGILSFIPYVQVAGFIPATILAILHSVDTGESFWWLMFLVVCVYIVVQIIQDAIVTPRIMGKIMGLSPAIVLLSLSIWGALLGIIGLIIALPTTTLIISYYHRYIVKEEKNEETLGQSKES